MVEFYHGKVNVGSSILPTSSMNFTEGDIVRVKRFSNWDNYQDPPTPEELEVIEKASHLNLVGKVCWLANHEPHYIEVEFDPDLDWKAIGLCEPLTSWVFCLEDDDLELMYHG